MSETPRVPPHAGIGNTLRDAAAALIARLEEMEGPVNSSLMSLWALGCAYSGPDWGEPLAAVKAALDEGGGDGEELAGLVFRYRRALQRIEAYTHDDPYTAYLVSIAREALDDADRS